MNYLLPLPDQEGVAQTRQLFLDKYGKVISEEQAADILGRIMKYIYLMTELDQSRSGEPTHPRSKPPQGQNPVQSRQG